MEKDKERDTLSEEGWGSDTHPQILSRRRGARPVGADAEKIHPSVLGPPSLVPKRCVWP